MTERTRLGVVMDPIDAIKYPKDSTLAMLLAAQARGFELAYLEQRDLLLRDGVAFGHIRPLTVKADPQAWFALGEPRSERLGDLDCILMRKDPPFDTEYIYTTYILERAEEQGALVVNRPQGLRDMNEKVYTAWFPQCCAPTLITRDMAEMAAFLREHAKIVCKPAAVNVVALPNGRILYWDGLEAEEDVNLKNGNVFFADQEVLANESVASSIDHGDTWRGGEALGLGGRRHPGCDLLPDRCEGVALVLEPGVNAPGAEVGIAGQDRAGRNADGDVGPADLHRRVLGEVPVLPFHDGFRLRGDAEALCHVLRWTHPLDGRAVDVALAALLEQLRAEG